jgi:hypothetical protein
VGATQRRLLLGPLEEAQAAAQLEAESQIDPEFEPLAEALAERHTWGNRLAHSSRDTKDLPWRLGLGLLLVHC